MRTEIDDLLARCGGVCSRHRLLSALTRNQLDDEIRRGRLTAVFPRAYCRPWDLDQAAVRDRAALVSVGPPAALSHVTALRRWGLPVAPGHEIHVTVPDHRRPTGRRGDLVVHRATCMPPAVRLEGMPAVNIETAITDSWPLLLGADQRAPAIEAVRRRLVTPKRLKTRVALRPNLPRRSTLLRLLDLLEAGCESELEIWGYLEVFDVPGLRHGVRQVEVIVAGRRFRLDLAFEAERVAIELDGRAFHASASQWERDTRRDLALATAGWQTIRMSHRRLTTDIAGCRTDALAVLASRRQGSRSG